MNKDITTISALKLENNLYHQKRIVLFHQIYKEFIKYFWIRIIFNQRFWNAFGTQTSIIKLARQLWSRLLLDFKES